MMTSAQLTLQRLLDTIARLRSPDGCPWDQAQTKESLRPYLLEEAYEVLEAIEGSSASELCDELGDLLLQIVLLARLHEEAGLFDFADVCAGINEKMIRRHPHVFSEPGRLLTPTELHHQWQKIKDQEPRRVKSPRQSFSPTLPALLLAQKSALPTGTDNLDLPTTLQSRLDGYLHALAGTPSESTEEALADLLLDLAHSAAILDINAELALRRRILLGKKSSHNEKS